MFISQISHSIFVKKSQVRAQNLTAALSRAHNYNSCNYSNRGTGWRDESSRSGRGSYCRTGRWRIPGNREGAHE
jgi:hypothetical protein